MSIFVVGHWRIILTGPCLLYVALGHNVSTISNIYCQIKLRLILINHKKLTFQCCGCSCMYNSPDVWRIHAHPICLSLQWRHYGRDSVSNHQPRGCLLNRLTRCRSKKTSKLRVTGRCAGNSPETGEFSAQRASNAENVSIWLRHHGVANRKRVRLVLDNMSSAIIVFICKTKAVQYSHELTWRYWHIHVAPCHPLVQRILINIVSSDDYFDFFSRNSKKIKIVRKFPQK